MTSSLIGNIDPARVTSFDPWVGSLEAALEARAQHDPDSGAPDPLVQFQAAQAILQERQRCESPDGGCVVLQAVRTCLMAGLVAPRWLAEVYLRMHSRVTDAEVATWDEAFGRYWPPRTRLDIERRHLRLRREVHASVWRLVVNDGRRINRDLFEELGELPGVSASGVTVERIYYAALEAGLPNPLALARRQSSANVPKDEDGDSLFFTDHQSLPQLKGSTQ